MSTDLKQDIIQAVRKDNCPDYKQNSHACFGCPWGELGETTYVCRNTKYDNDTKTHKVKPRKITHGFCTICGKSVKFRLDWDGVASPTRKGIITYKELYAYCPHCDNQIYVPAVNDINVYRREKAYAEKKPTPIPMPIASGEVAKAIEKMMQIRPSEETERGIELLKEIFAGGNE